MNAATEPQFFEPLPHELADVQPQQQLVCTQTEAAVLSVLANFSQAFDEYADRLSVDCFTSQEHKAIWAALVRQVSTGKGFDVLTLVVELTGVVDAAYCNELLMSHDFSSRGIARMVERLVDMHQSRRLHALSYRMAELAFADGPASERIDRAQAELQALEVQGGEDEWVDAYTAALEHSAFVEQRHEGKVHGLPTGLATLDNMLDGGFVRGNLVVIGARPAMGKSALGMTIGLHMARDYSVGLLSMEMPHNDVRDRQAAIVGRIPLSQIKRPNVGEGLDYSRLVDAVEASRNLRFVVSDRSSLNIQQVRSMARKLKRSRGLDVLVLDYIGLMEGLDKKQSRAYQIEEISRGLKALAKELDIVVLCLAQVNRGAAEKAMQPPGLHELRDSGAIEQDADVVAFIHRPIAANPGLEAKWANYAQLRIAKNRQGRIGDIHLFYHGEQTRFDLWGGEPPGSGPVEMAQPRRRGMQE